MHGTTPVAIELTLANVWPRAKNTLIQEHTTYCYCSTGSGDDVSWSVWATVLAIMTLFVRSRHFILAILTNQITTQ